MIEGREFAAPGDEPIAAGRERFVELFKGRRTPIKSALLNQKLLAGVGNIYAGTRVCSGVVAEAQDAADEGGAGGVALAEAIEAEGSSVRRTGRAVPGVRNGHPTGGGGRTGAAIIVRSASGAAPCKGG